MLKPEARVIVDLASAAFPKLGTEVFDAAEARRMLAARPSPVLEPIEVGAVVDRTVPGLPGGSEVRVRVYWPVGDDGGQRESREGDLPVVVFLHGGGFTLCGLDSHDRLCRTLANGVGTVVVSVDYRQAPEDRFPAAAEDAYAVVRWVAAHAAEIGGDPARIAVAGDSAGGNLAAVTALMARDRGGPTLASQALIYPMLDPSCDTDSYREYADDHFTTAAHLRWYWEQYLGPGGATADPYAAPVLAEDLSGLPPAYILTAECDPLRDEGEAYGARLRAAGVDTEIVRCAGQFHGFVSMADHLPDAKEAVAGLFSVLRRALGV
ncbi:alpha/beta hydrolase [Nocardia puris]|uniref:alpha/beta hydrolase n=1 Tax=Nocardia puris TaxID=208602 RepID=UPI002B4B0D70|nr:alpha/beta hydrolase [Nocardia puris]